MRAVRERKARAEQAARRVPPAGISLLMAAVVLSAAVVGVGVLRGPKKLDAARDARPSTVVVNLSEQDRQRLDGWHEFFACHGLARSDLVMIATLRANGAWKPDKPITLELSPSADQPPPTYKELEVLNRVTALTDGTEDRELACGGAVTDAAEDAQPAPEPEPDADTEAPA